MSVNFELVWEMNKVSYSRQLIFGHFQVRLLAQISEFRIKISMGNDVLRCEQRCHQT